MNAIARAVTSTARAESVHGRRESARGSQRLGFLAHELRNLINTAILAFDVLKTGNVGVSGSTGACSIAASWDCTRLTRLPVLDVAMAESCGGGSSAGVLVANPDPLVHDGSAELVERG